MWIVFAQFFDIGMVSVTRPLSASTFHLPEYNGHDSTEYAACNSQDDILVIDLKHLSVCNASRIGGSLDDIGSRAVRANANAQQNRAYSTARHVWLRRIILVQLISTILIDGHRRSRQ